MEQATRPVRAGATILERLSRRLWDVIPAVILGQRAQLYAWRNNISGFARSPSLVTVFWNIEKK